MLMIVLADAAAAGRRLCSPWDLETLPDCPPNCKLLPFSTVTSTGISSLAVCGGLSGSGFAAERMRTTKTATTIPIKTAVPTTDPAMTPVLSFGVSGVVLGGGGGGGGGGEGGGSGAGVGVTAGRLSSMATNTQTKPGSDAISFGIVANACLESGS